MAGPRICPHSPGWAFTGGQEAGPVTSPRSGHTHRGHWSLARADAGIVAVLGLALAEANKDCCVSRVDRVIPSPRLMTPGSRTGGNNGNIEGDIRHQEHQEDNDWDGDKVSACHPGIVAN